MNNNTFGAVCVFITAVVILFPVWLLHDSAARCPTNTTMYDPATNKCYLKEYGMASKEMAVCPK